MPKKPSEFRNGETELKTKIYLKIKDHSRILSKNDCTQITAT